MGDCSGLQNAPSRTTHLYGRIGCEAKDRSRSARGADVCVDTELSPLHWAEAGATVPAPRAWS